MKRSTYLYEQGFIPLLSLTSIFFIFPAIALACTNFFFDANIDFNAVNIVLFGLMLYAIRWVCSWFLEKLTSGYDDDEPHVDVYDPSGGKCA